MINSPGQDKQNVPRVVYKETPVDDNVNVDEILGKINNLKGEVLNKNTVLLFEDLLNQLTDYVTLIQVDVMTGYYSLQYHEVQDILVYFYNRDVAHLLALNLELENTHNLMGKELILYEIDEYKKQCFNNQRCLVYDIDERYGEREYKLNYTLSSYRVLVEEGYLKYKILK